MYSVWVSWHDMFCIFLDAEAPCHVFFSPRHFTDDTGLMHFSAFFTLQMTWEFAFFLGMSDNSHVICRYYNWFVSLSPLASIFLEDEHYGRIHCKFHFFSSARRHGVAVCNSQASSFEHGHAGAADVQINLRHMQWKPRTYFSAAHGINEWRSAIAKQTHLSTVMWRRLISKSTSPFLSLPFPFSLSFPVSFLPFPCTHSARTPPFKGEPKETNHPIPGFHLFPSPTPLNLFYRSIYRRPTHSLAPTPSAAVRAGKLTDLQRLLPTHFQPLPCTHAVRSRSHPSSLIPSGFFSQPISTHSLAPTPSAAVRAAKLAHLQRLLPPTHFQPLPCTHAVRSRPRRQTRWSRAASSPHIFAVHS